MSSLEEKSTDLLWGLLFEGNAGPVQLDVWKILAKRSTEKPDEVLKAYKETLDKVISKKIPDEVKWGLENCPLCGNPVLSCGPNWQVEGTGDCDEMFTCTYCAVSYTYEIRGVKGKLMQFSIRLGPEKNWNGNSLFLRVFGNDPQNDFEPIFDIVNSDGRWIGSYSFKTNQWRSGESMKDPSKKSDSSLWSEPPEEIVKVINSAKTEVSELTNLLNLLFT